MLKMMNKKCEKFLDWISDKLEPVCENMNKYPSLVVCVILGFIFTLVISCIF